MPTIKKDFKKILSNRNFSFYIDENDKQTICFNYPKKHMDESILQVVRLEIGCLAEPIPAKRESIRTYIEETYPEIFDENIEVVAVDSIRTFYEKITILHREANRLNGNYPKRYSRHFYDVYKMLTTNLKRKSFENLGLLNDVVEFKKKFYPCNWAQYDDIKNGYLKLIPSSDGLKIFSKDYTDMKNMIFW